MTTDLPLASSPYEPAPLVPIGVDISVDSHAAAQREIIRARVVLALQRPRDIERSRQLILKECQRPRFARYGKGGGLYKVPGKGSGLSIRFAEAAMRCLGNLHADVQVLREDVDYRYLVVSVMDLETNSTHGLPVSVPKTVERRDPKDRDIISQRTNSRNQTVFKLEATEDELLTLQNNMLAKARRQLILMHVPGDIQDEAEDTMLETQRNRDAADPKAAMRELLDAFDRLNVPANEVREFLGKPVEQASGPDLTRLREVWSAVTEGVDWRDVLNAERERRLDAAPAAGNADAEVKPGAKAKPASKVGAGLLGELADKAKPKGRPAGTPEAAAMVDSLVDTTDKLRDQGAFDGEPEPEAPGDLPGPDPAAGRVNQDNPMGPGPSGPPTADSGAEVSQDYLLDRTTRQPVPPVIVKKGRTEAGGFSDDDDGLQAALQMVWTNGRTYKGRTLQEIIDADAGLVFLLRQAHGTRMAEEAPDLHAAAIRVVEDPMLQVDVEALRSQQ